MILSIHFLSIMKCSFHAWKKKPRRLKKTHVQNSKHIIFQSFWVSSTKNDQPSDAPSISPSSQRVFNSCPLKPLAKHITRWIQTKRLCATSQTDGEIRMWPKSKQTKRHKQNRIYDPYLAYCKQLSQCRTRVWAGGTITENI